MIDETYDIGRYPRWEKTWTEKLSDVDDQIVAYFKSTAETTGEALDNITDRIANWFDRSNLDTETSAEFAKVKADSKVLRARIEQRITHLEQNGRIKLARMQQGSDQL